MPRTAAVLPFDHDEDWALADNIQTVDYVDRDLEGTEIVHSNVQAWRTAIEEEHRDISQGGQIVIHTCRWHIRASTLDVEVKHNSRIRTASDGDWEILSSALQDESTDWVVTAREL